MAAILAADVAGYSRLTEADEEGTHARLKAHRRELIDPKIKEHHGRIVKTTGDGVLVEFPSVVEAVRCAVEVQHGMAERNANTPQRERIEFRVGINLGDIILEEQDIYGDGVNIAARLENLARPGSVYLSGTAFDQVENKIALRCKFLGAQRVKNIAKPVRVYRIRLERGATATAPWRQWRTGLVAGAALLIVIGVAGAAYMQHHASLTESASMPPSPKSEAQGATTPADVPKETPPLDAQVWEAIRNSTNPADYEAYLRIFPTGVVAGLARERLKALAPARHPPAIAAGPVPAAPAPTPQQKELATKSVPPVVPAPQPPASTDASTSTTQAPAPQQQAGAASTTAAAPAAAPQQQAVVAPDLSKSVTSPALPAAPYDGEWKGVVLGPPVCTYGPCGGSVKATVAKNVLSGKMESRAGNVQISGTIANDGSFAGKVRPALLSGKFDEDRFQGVIREPSGPSSSFSGTMAVFLERAK